MENHRTIIEVHDKQSLIHLGSLDSFDITPGGKKAAGLILKYLRTGKTAPLQKAVRIYEALIPNENFGGEYTALEWLCRLFLAPEEAREDLLRLPLPASFYNMLCDNDYENLIYYLNNKYHIADDKSIELSKVKTRMRFLEDFILFINPDRERWETTRENLRRCELAPGMRIADVGSGPGYYTFKFADIVGETGRVYAIETNPRHLEFLRGYIEKNHVGNIEVVKSSFEGIGLSPEIRVDVVFICSLYHNIYAAFTDDERDQFVHSIRRALLPGGRLIIVDNDLVEEQELPYHGPYISKDLIISQLYYYGFRLHNTFQFSPQRYVLIFDQMEIPAAQPDILPRMPEKPSAPPEQIDVPPLRQIPVFSTASLLRFRIIGTSTSGYTRRGKQAGRMLYEGLSARDAKKISEARNRFSDLWPKERIGDDYTALIWLADYALADEQTREERTADAMNRFYAQFFCENDFERLKTYLLYKFHLEKPDDSNASDYTSYEYDGQDFPIGTLNQWNEFMVFNNPNRNLWEKTEEMCGFFHVRPGERIADLGCGDGYFSWYFSKAVGEKGLVYATEINQDALSFLQEFIREAHVGNIRPLVTKMNETGLPKNSVDTIFMCSMYHAVYITDIEFVKDAFLAGIHRALRKGGRLIIVDNQITQPGVPSYYGSGIYPDLIVSQLSYYGFRLKERFQAIPQRYALIFEEEEGYEPKIVKAKFSGGRMGQLFRQIRGGGNQPEGPEFHAGPGKSVYDDG